MRRPLVLPGGRAIVGGLLVAVSVLGIFATHRAATTTTLANWLVVRRPVSAGAVITADDLALAPMDLYDDTRSRALADPRSAVGRVALVPLERGDLLLRSNIVAGAGRPSTGRRVGVSLDAADALGGDLRAGDRVDIVAIASSTAPDDQSSIIVRGAMVSSVGGASDGGVGSSDRVDLNLEVPTEEAARAVVDAAAKGGVSLIAASTVTLDQPR
ncbi:MAG: RcpC/CpaB family pilus assembly protein [Acidimicrobiales bacterium]